MVDIAGPYSLSDGFAVTADGSVAIVRTREYRIDWVNRDGTRTVGPRMPYLWHALSDAEKAHLVDSVNAASNKAFADKLAARAQDSIALSQGRAVASAPSGRLPAAPTTGTCL